MVEHFLKAFSYFSAVKKQAFFYLRSKFCCDKSRQQTAGGMTWQLLLCFFWHLAGPFYSAIFVKEMPL
jgi:hypothetical protein